MNMIAQGDLLFTRRASLPSGTTQEKPQARVVVGHSETGHDHYLEARLGLRYYRSADPLISYLEISDMPAEVLHARQHHTHAPAKLEPGVWEIRRQREWTPEGFRRVED